MTDVGVELFTFYKARSLVGLCTYYLKEK